jgi:hypothetical protein
MIILLWSKISFLINEKNRIFSFALVIFTKAAKIMDKNLVKFVNRETKIFQMANSNAS